MTTNHTAGDQLSPRHPIAGVVTLHAADRRVGAVGVRIGAVDQVLPDLEGMLAVELGHVVTSIEASDATLVES